MCDGRVADGRIRGCCFLGIWLLCFAGHAVPLQVGRRVAGVPGRRRAGAVREPGGRVRAYDCIASSHYYSCARSSPSAASANSTVLEYRAAVLWDHARRH